MFFKYASTIAIFLLGSVWAWRNFRWINDWMATKTGIGKTSEQRTVTTSNNGVTYVIASTSSESNVSVSNTN